MEAQGVMEKLSAEDPKLALLKATGDPRPPVHDVACHDASVQGSGLVRIPPSCLGTEPESRRLARASPRASDQRNMRYESEKGQLFGCGSAIPF
jgi:hypothetical protein